MLSVSIAQCLVFLAATGVTLAHPWTRDTAQPKITVVEANSSTRWLENTSQVQIIDVLVNNTGNVWLTSSHDLTVHVQSPSLTTVHQARVKRLRPGDSAIVEVGVQNNQGVQPGTSGAASVIAQWSHTASSSLNITATYGIPTYEASKSSIDKHESPDWWRNAKYGIFIHWGIYSVPAWGNRGSNESYAEWYWSHQMNPSDKTQTYQYHLDHYGENFLYDDFIANFTAEKFNPKEWVDLFEDAGAKYFVQVTKHHDGFALFDMPDSVSQRNSVQLTPHRDFLKEIFDAAKKYQPHLHRGTYFSLPEWFNPLYTKYEMKNEFGVGPPKNPYTNETVPYTGLVEVDDFLSGVQLPQMNILAYDYDTEIMWCDIGGANLAPEFAAQWLNDARSNNRQVTLNSRCGGVTGDFATPEYKSVGSTTEARHWEATRGMDPYSFGYNAATADADYMNATALVTLLVDIVAKNGNFLLDVGPRADGTIADVMQTNLREAGSWIKAHAESIFDTKYWPSGPGQDNLRYTTTDDAFYIHVLSQPSGSLTIPDAVPYLEGDRVTVVGGSKHGSAIGAKLDGSGQLVLNIPDDVGAADKYTWTFKITY